MQTDPPSTSFSPAFRSEISRTIAGISAFIAVVGVLSLATIALRHMSGAQDFDLNASAKASMVTLQENQQAAADALATCIRRERANVDHDADPKVAAALTLERCPFEDIAFARAAMPLLSREHRITRYEFLTGQTPLIVRVATLEFALKTLAATP